MYFGLQDTKPPPCPLHLTKQGGSIHWSQLYLYTVYKLVLYILETITVYCIITSTKADTNKYTEIIAVFFFFAGYFSGEEFATSSFHASAPGLLHGEC